MPILSLLNINIIIFENQFLPLMQMRSRAGYPVSGYPVHCYIYLSRQAVLSAT